LPSAHYKVVGVRIYKFSELITHPAHSPVYGFAAYLAIGLAQNSGRSGSLLLSREGFFLLRFMPVRPGALKSPDYNSTRNAGTAINSLF
jgi:hypothetical protein